MRGRGDPWAHEESGRKCCTIAVYQAFARGYPLGRDCHHEKWDRGTSIPVFIYAWL